MSEYRFPNLKLRADVNGAVVLLYKAGGNVTEPDARMTADENLDAVCESLVADQPNLLKEWMQRTAYEAMIFAKRFSIPYDQMWDRWFTEREKRRGLHKARRAARKGERD